jgi:biofilm PGA synthesis N-glycosyltransferase PgaC
MQIEVMDIFFYVWCVLLAWQVFHHAFIYFRTATINQVPPAPTQPVSVIVSARNERENLEKNLPRWLEQEYPDFEVVVVNDGSTDGTSDFLREMESLHSNLKIVRLDIDERFHRGKKFALTMGIKGSKHELLLLTDADCYPSSNSWIQHMASKFIPGKDIVLGLGHYERNWKPLNWIIQHDTFQTAMNYMNYALAGKPYMGVGRNLAYRKSLFFKHKGFASHQHLIAGDDDLFVNEAANSENVAICLHPDAATVSVPHRKPSAYFKQKLRHYSTGRQYKWKHTFWLGIFPTSLLFFVLTTVFFLLGKTEFTLYVLIGAGFWYILHLSAVSLNAVRLGYPKYAWLSPIFFPFLILQHVLIGLRGLFYKPLKWN